MIILTGDVSATENTFEAKVNERIRLALEFRDSDITVNLREYKDKKSNMTVVHLATAISVNDLLHQIEHECLSETPIPSIQWLQLQFWFKDPTRLSSLQYTGLLPLKFIVQTCQL
ncbi:uncharacterized protein LOC111112916 isoform X2 [Rhizophagus clarus]|uniref:Uncharacterized protein LOC111112916 isoform X2 n=1 Tax=Rhizophagus clarus TaxID=94130 RepID=A0A8H3L1V8_9GLOM|nr:uncharacterized protein LOC111112916 isoform X2 [Rhizophagus clarus]